MFIRFFRGAGRVNVSFVSRCALRNNLFLFEYKKGINQYFDLSNIPYR